MNISKYEIKPYFEKNLGQLPSEVKYKIKTNDYITFLTKDKLVVSLPSNIKDTRNIFYMKLENINEDVDIKGQNKQRGRVSYLIGNNESKWIKNIPTFSRVKYEEVYENIDLYYYVNNKNLEYDFVLSKGANPDNICIRLEGVDNIEINEENDLVLTVGDIKVVLLKPEVYQIIDNIKINIDCEYRLDNKDINFLVKDYDKEYNLVLDPVLKLDYSTYIGGTKCDFATGIAVDHEGYAYITGYTGGDYPTTTGQMAYGGGEMDAFVTKISVDGKELVYSTYVGGAGADYSNGIVVDSIGCAYITGTTQSSKFPTTSDSYQPIYREYANAFVTKLNSTGDLLMYSTYIGGTYTYTVAFGIAIDKEGCTYITGQTQQNYPVTTGVFQQTFSGGTDAFVTKLDMNGRNLIYSTYLGGADYDAGYGIAVDKEGCAYITGYAGVEFPTTKWAYQPIYGGDAKDAFVSKVSADGSKLIYSTFLGGSSIDQGNAITVDNEGYAYVVGFTQGNFPTMQSYQNSFKGKRDIFISKVSIDGSGLVYSTYLGDSNTENSYAIAVDDNGYAYVTGYSVGDAFLTKLSVDGSQLITNASLYNGNNDYGRGIAIDSKGSIYITGYAEGGYPTTPEAYQTVCGGDHDVFVSKILLIDFDISLNFKQSKVKLLDIINTKLIFKNTSQINLDINIKYQPLDSTVSFIQDSLCIQGVNKASTTIPETIYLSNIAPQKTAEIEIDLKYIKEIFPSKIPMVVTVEVYDNRSVTPVLIDSRTTTFYIDTTVGINYIPGCNADLYNLEINGKLQTDDTGTPIIYYKSEKSYIYIEPDGDKYGYKVLLNPNYVIEHKII